MYEMLPFVGEPLDPPIQPKQLSAPRSISAETLALSEHSGAFLPFLRREIDFLPEGATFEDLTEEQLARLKILYRYDPYRPGLKQGITNIANRYAKWIFAGYGM